MISYYASFVFRLATLSVAARQLLVLFFDYYEHLFFFGHLFKMNLRVSTCRWCRLASGSRPKDRRSLIRIRRREDDSARNSDKRDSNRIGKNSPERWEENPEQRRPVGPVFRSLMSRRRYVMKGWDDFSTWLCWCCSVGAPRIRLLWFLMKDE